MRKKKKKNKKSKIISPILSQLLLCSSCRKYVNARLEIVKRKKSKIFQRTYCCPECKSFIEQNQTGSILEQVDAD